MVTRLIDIFRKPAGGEAPVAEIAVAGAPAVDELRAQFSGLSLLEGIDPEIMREIESEIEWFAIPGGWEVFHQGDPGDGLYIVKSGCLGVMAPGPDGRSVLVTQIHPGQTVGEMSLISGEARSATVIAFRDSEVFRLNKQSFHKLVDNHPRFLAHINQMLVRRLQRMSSLQTPVDISRTFALLPIGESEAWPGFSRLLANALGRFGFRTRVLDSSAARESTDWFGNIERDHDILLYEARADVGDWTRLCIRQADRVLLVADATRPPHHLPDFEGILGRSGVQPVEAVFIQPEGAAQTHPVAHWLDKLEIDIHWHVRHNSARDIDRLARLLTGRAVSLVLSGGGARGFAHIGAIQALRECGMPIDLVGGTSMGAIVGAGVAMEWDDDEIMERMRRCFVATDPLADLTLPIIALVKGAKVSRLLQHEFADMQIEDLWRSLFVMTANMTKGTTRSHRRGLLWRALRASVAIPGLLPPLVEAGDLLADGGIINNFPVDVAYAARRGPIIGVDVGNYHPFDPAPPDFDEKSPLWFWRNRHKRIPGIVSLLMRAGTISGDMRAREAKRHLSLIIEPKMPYVGLRDWQAFGNAVRAGYESTLHAMETSDLSTFRDIM